MSQFLNKFIEVVNQMKSYASDTSDEKQSQEKGSTSDEKQSEESYKKGGYIAGRSSGKGGNQRERGRSSFDSNSSYDKGFLTKEDQETQVLNAYRNGINRKFLLDQLEKDK
ncbi:unnamed protein product, partial [Dovyalis caffra]